MQKITPTEEVWGESMDVVFFMVLLERMNTPIKRLPAYKIGLIDAQGKVLKEPENAEERRALTLVDRMALEFRKVAAGRVPVLKTFERKKKHDPNFVRARARAIGFKFFKYYDM